MNNQPPPVLTIAGSDSGGAAGLQADLKTFTALGVYGMNAITAVTAQNSVQVRAVHFLPPELVQEQIRAVLSDYGARAIKTGFIGSPLLVEVVARELAAYREQQKFLLVVDPVLVNHRGDALFPSDVAQAYLEHLFPLAQLITPNRHEAELLVGQRVETVEEMSQVAHQLSKNGSAVLVKGGGQGGQIIDIFYDGQQPVSLAQPLLDTNNNHGSGDTLSAAIVAFSAQGDNLATAVRRAHSFTWLALQGATGWRLGAGHGPVDHYNVDP